MSIEIDSGELSSLSADLRGSGSKIAPFARAAVEHTAFEVKRPSQRHVSGSKRFGPLPASIDYDMQAGPDWVGAEVGFKKDGQGNMGHWWEYGSRNFPARAPLGRSLEENQADFVRGITKAAEDALGL